MMSSINVKEYSIAAAEVNKILRYTSDVDVNKIPVGLRIFLKEIADPNYVVDINPSISLETQKISTKAKEILAMIYCYYWCSEEELDHLNEELKNEVQNTSQELFGNVNTDLLFEEAKQRQKNSLEQSGMANSLSERKAPWYKRLFGFIKK
ncbi:MAG: hypothetical protein J6B87_05355 [Clostridia bacterium]|nr:hypothetical protein [Clostridia bacterium]